MNIKIDSVARNKKTGDFYIVQDIVTDATNANSGRAMVLYKKAGDYPRQFVRELYEFEQKFENVEIEI
jgi:hypothetical protein